MPGPTLRAALPSLAAAAAFALGATTAACGKSEKGVEAPADPMAASVEASAALARFQEKVGFKALHTGPRKLPMVFRLGEGVPETWVPVIQEAFDAWERGVGKDLFAFAGGTLSGRASVRVKTSAADLAVPFEDGFWSIVSSKKGLCPNKTGDNPAACARFTPSRDDGGHIVDWHPVEQDVIFDVGSYDFRPAPPASALAAAPDDAAPAEGTDAEVLAISLRQVLAHELGHVLGLPHTTGSEALESIMGPASLARKGTYVEDGPVAPQSSDHGRVRQLIAAWEAGGVK